MKEKNYSEVYTEVLEIISHFPDEEYQKIPSEEIEFYKQNMDKEYKFEIDPSKELKEQNIKRETYAIIINLYMDYFANEKQREILNNLLKENEEKLEKTKREKYNPDNIFKKTNIENVEITEENNSEDKNAKQIIEYKESFFNKILKFIKELLHSN